MKTKILFLTILLTIKSYKSQALETHETVTRSSYNDDKKVIDKSEIVDLQSGTGNYTFEIAELKSGDLIKKLQLNIRLGSVNHFDNFKNSYGVNVSVNVDGILRKTINHIDDSLRIRPQELPNFKNPSSFLGFLQNRFEQHALHYQGGGYFTSNWEGFYHHGNISLYSIFDMDWENDVFETNFEGNKNFFTYNNGLKFLYYNNDITVSKQPYLNLKYRDLLYKYAKNGRNTITVPDHGIFNLLNKGTSVYMPTEIIKNDKSIKFHYLDGNEAYIYGTEKKIHPFNDASQWAEYLYLVYGGDPMTGSIYNEIYNSCIQFYQNPSQLQINNCKNYARNHPLVQQSVGNETNFNNQQESTVGAQSITNKIFNEIESDEVKVRFNYQTIASQKIIQNIIIQKRSVNGVWKQDKKHEFTYYNYNGDLFLHTLSTFNFENNQYSFVDKKTFLYYDYNILNTNEASIIRNEKGIKVSKSNNDFMPILKAGAVKSIKDEVTNEVLEIVYGADVESFQQDININDIYGLRIKELISLDVNTGNKIKSKFEYYNKNDYQPSNIKITKTKAISVNDNNILGRKLTRSEGHVIRNENFGNIPLYGKIKKINPNNSYILYHFQFPKYRFEENIHLTMLESQLTKVENFTSNNVLSSEYHYTYEPLQWNDSQHTITEISDKIINGFKTKFYVQESFNSIYTTSNYFDQTSNIVGPFTFLNVEVIPFYNIKKPALMKKEINEYMPTGKVVNTTKFYTINNRNLLDNIKILNSDGSTIQTFYEYDSERKVIKEKKCYNSKLMLITQNYYNHGLLLETLTNRHQIVLSHWLYKYDNNNNLIDEFDTVTNKRLSYYFGYNYTKLIMKFNDLSIEDVANSLHSSSEIGSSNYLLQNYNNTSLKNVLKNAKRFFGNHMISGYTYDKFGIRDEIFSSNENINYYRTKNTRGDLLQNYQGTDLHQEFHTNHKGISETFSTTENLASYGRYDGFFIKSHTPTLQISDEICN